MSDYCKEKVLRVPLDKYGFVCAKEYEDYLKDRDILQYLQYGEVDAFQIAPTERLFLDLVLEYNYGSEYNEYGRTRALSDKEKFKYNTVFKTMLSNINMDDVRLVEFCWYNCSEAPNYYDEENDEFYKEV